MSVESVLKFNINTFLNSQGFQQFKANLKQSMSLSQKFKSVTSSTLGQLAIGYFTISGLVGQYNKAVEASNYQIEQEAKLYNTLRAQKFRDEQIKSIIDLTGSLQSLGVVGDEVTIAGAQQLATYRLQEDSIKNLLPSMQDLLVKQKGLNGTGQDMEGIASMFAKSINGQTMALKRSGIILSEREEQLLKVGTEEQKVALLTEAVRRSIGEQNKEMLKTPEGKITSAKNRIGDLYEVWGMSVRETRAKFWEFVADNAEGLKDVVNRVFKAGASFVDTFLGVFRDIKKGFNALPDGAKNAFKIIGGLALATKFPLVTLFLAIEDIFGAFQGKESFTEDAVNALMDFFGADYKFEDLRKGVSDFWDLWTKGADSGIEKINLTTKILSDLLDILKGGAGLLQMLWGGTVGVFADTGKNIYKTLTGNFEEINFDYSYGNIKSGFQKVTNSGKNILKTDDMHSAFLLDEANKKIQEQVELEKYINVNRGVKGVPLNDDYSVDLRNLTNILSTFKEPKTLNTKTVQETKKMIKPEVTLTNTPTYNTNVTINEATDGAKIQKMLDNSLRSKEKQDMKNLKAQLGIENYKYGFGY